MITNTSQITAQQLKDLKQLMAACKKKDGSIPNLYTHILTQPRVFPASLLYYKRGQLLGFLSVYFFYDEAVEVSLLIHPQIRRKGIAKKLLTEILPLIQSQNYPTLIFSSPAKLNDSWLLSHGFAYDHSEYFMERTDLNPLLNFNNTPMSFRTATHDDITMLCAMDELCFSQQQSNALQRFEHIIEGREYQVLLALQHNEVIGKAHLRWEKKGATLSDIAIIPSKQGQGLGSALIAHCINLALSEGKPHLNLDVETHNQKALDLYTRLGFFISNACDYWKISLESLHKWVNNIKYT